MRRPIYIASHTFLFKEQNNCESGKHDRWLTDFTPEKF